VFGYLAGLCVPATRAAFVRGLKWIVSAAVLIGGCEAVYLICYRLSVDAMLTDRAWHSLWQPRYLGFIWPATALAAGALIMRLPTRPIRGLAILIVLAINLSFGLGRIFGHTEPSVDQMARDAFASQSIDSPTRTYFNIRTAAPTPAHGTLFTFPGHYYMQMNAWLQPMTPQRFRQLLDEFTFRRNYNPGMIAEEVNDTRFLNQVIVWDEFSTKANHDANPLKILMPGWRLSSETWYPLRYFWDWQDLLRFRRREYTRISATPSALPPIPSQFGVKHP
jgi:hypothetical protein